MDKPSIRLAPKNGAKGIPITLLSPDVLEIEDGNTEVIDEIKLPCVVISSVFKYTYLSEKLCKKLGYTILTCEGDDVNKLFANKTNTMELVQYIPVLKIQLDDLTNIRMGPVLIQKETREIQFGLDFMKKVQGKLIVEIGQLNIGWVMFDHESHDPTEISGYKGEDCFIYSDNNGNEKIIITTREKDILHCDFCNSAGTIRDLKMCPCKTVFYCNKTCQKSDWSSKHKRVCSHSKNRSR